MSIKVKRDNIEIQVRTTPSFFGEVFGQKPTEWKKFAGPYNSWNIAQIEQHDLEGEYAPAGLFARGTEFQSVSVPKCKCGRK